MLLSPSEPKFVGSMARRLLALVPTVTVKLRTLPLQESELNEDPLRPSSHCSICNEVTTGTPRAWAEATMYDAPGPG